MTVDLNTILTILLISILLPAIGVALSAIAGGATRSGRRPPEHDHGWENRQRNNSRATRRK